MTHSFRSSPIYLDFTDVIDLYRKWCLVLSARFPVVKWRSRSVEFEICAGNRLNSARMVNCLRVFLAALSKVKFIRKASSSLMKEQVSRLTKSASLISSLISSHLATRVKDWSQGLRRKDWILRSLFLAVTSLCPQKVGSRDEIYWAKWKLMLISDQAKDLVKNCVEGEGSMYTFSTAGLHPGSWINRLDESRKVSMPRCMRRKLEFFGVIWHVSLVLNVEILWMVFGIVIAAKVISCAIYPGFIEGVDRQNSERVKGGMSLQNGMWHGLPNDIIMRNVIYGNVQRNKLNRKSYVRLCRVFFGRRLSLAQIWRRNCFFYQQGRAARWSSWGLWTKLFLVAVSFTRLLGNDRLGSPKWNKQISLVNTCRRILCRTSICSLFRGI